MVHFRPSAAGFRWPAIQFARCFAQSSVIAGLVAAALPVVLVRPAAANEFESCARALTDAGLEAAVVAAACGQALHPDQVSACVTGVLAAADVTALSALSACSRDRRPKEVATCVSDIHAALPVERSDEVLEKCHLSILPQRYSACVVGLSQGAGLAVAESLNECLSAGYRPVDVAPTFVPQ
jgi:hypothetical protein